MIVIGVPIFLLAAALIIYINSPSTSTIGNEMTDLQEKIGEIQELTITHHTSPQGNADIERHVTLENPEVIQQLLDEAAPTEIKATDAPPPEYTYTINTVTSESRYLLFVYEEGISINNSDHYTIEGDNHLIQAIENGDYEW